MCGFHEVTYTQGAKDILASHPDRVPWRVSSTLFSHVRRDVLLEPL